MNNPGGAARVVLKRGRDRPVREQHPWVFSGAIDEVFGEPLPGGIVDVMSAQGMRLGRGAFSPHSQIRVRLLSFGEEVPAIDDAFVASRLAAALSLRKRHVLTELTDAARLCFGEGDGLPGLVVDLYRDVVVLQCLSAFAEAVRPVVIETLRRELGPCAIVDRSDAEVRRLEGLPARTEVVLGAVPDPVSILENGCRYRVDVLRGHKTGFYLDQRDARQRLREMARGAAVLNCFCYTGGFSVAALRGGATSTLSVDASMPALELGRANALDNGFADETHDWLKGDCFEVLRGLRAEQRTFDVVVLDPPKFAPSAAHVDKAARGYLDLAKHGVALLNPGGLLFTFSCSGAVDRSLFRRITADAFAHQGRVGQVLQELGHPLDHPVGVGFPEGEYLKGFIVRAM